MSKSSVKGVLIGFGQYREWNNGNSSAQDIFVEENSSNDIKNVLCLTAKKGNVNLVRNIGTGTPVDVDFYVNGRMGTNQHEGKVFNELSIDKITTQNQNQGGNQNYNQNQGGNQNYNQNQGGKQNYNQNQGGKQGNNQGGGNNYGGGNMNNSQGNNYQNQQQPPNQDEPPQNYDDSNHGY